jgi:hypothetical protein
MMDDMAGAILTPDELVVYLWEHYRLKRSKRTLQWYRRVGGGPQFFRAGNEVRYSTKLTDEWAINMRGEPVHSTTEARVRKGLP